MNFAMTGTVREKVDRFLDTLFLRHLTKSPLYSSSVIDLHESKQFDSTAWVKRMIGGGRLALQVTTLGWGGTERYVQDLAIGFADAGLNPLVIVDHEPFIRRSCMEDAGVEVRALDVHCDVGKREYCEILQQVLLSEQVRLLHANAWMRWPWIVETCDRNHKAYISTCHSTVVVTTRRLLGMTIRPPLSIWVNRAKARRTKPAIISTSDGSTVALRQYWGKTTRTATVHLGIPAPSSLVVPGSHADAPVFTWVGSIISRKRPLLMLSAFAELVRDFPMASLVVVGDGPLRGDSEQFVSKCIPGKVKFLGFTDRVDEQLSKSQAFVLTSANEGLSYVTLEAMSHGLPVVATDCGVITEAVVNGLTGIVVAKDDQKALTQAMKRIAGDHELRKSMGRAGFERWYRLFTIDRMIDQTLRAYVALLDGHQL